MAVDRVVLLQALAVLPARMRAALVLHYYADLSVDEAAHALGTSRNTVKSQLREGLRRLRRELAAPADSAPMIEELPDA